MAQTIDIPEQDIPVLLHWLQEQLQRIPGQPVNALTRFKAQLLNPHHRPRAQQTWREDGWRVRHYEAHHPQARQAS